MEPARVIVLVFLLLFIFAAPDPPSRRVLFIDDTRQAKLRHQYEILANSSYGDLDAKAGRWVNLTGFREHDGYSWDLLPTVQSISRQQFDTIHHGPGSDGNGIYKDFHGEVRGKFVRNIHSSTRSHPLNISAINPAANYLYITNEYLRNITERKGELAIKFIDTADASDPARPIRADLALWTDTSPGNGWQAVLRGVHLKSGSIIMSTSSAKFNAFPVFPQFALDSVDFNSSKPFANETITKLSNRGDDSPDILLGIPHCELVIWLHPQPVVYGQATGTVERIEQELRHPEGAPIGTAPPMIFSAVIFSPDCGYILEAPSIYGPKVEVYLGLARGLIMAFSVILGLKITLLRRQMHRSTTPSTKSRIAYQSLVIAALGDGLILFIMVGILVLDEVPFLPVAVAAFLACVHVAFLEIKFVFEIWTVQVGDPARAEEDRQRRTAPAPIADGTLPLPATAQRTDGATPVILPPDQDAGPASSVRTSFASVYSRFYFALVVLMFFSIWSLSWPRGARSTYANTLVFCYFSFWIPQIYRNIIRNCRKALNWDYVVGTSVLRMIPILYWYTVENNLLGIETSQHAAVLLGGWVWLQVAVLVSQQFLGPRLFVRDSWCPPAYDYHPVLQDDLEAGGLPVGLLASASEGKDKDDKTRKVFDCAICMNEIDVPVISKEKDGSATTWLEQRNYMVTPCRHIFHTECLEGWMNLRLVCPVCRETLPPL